MATIRSQYGENLLPHFITEVEKNLPPVLATSSLKGPQAVALRVKIGPDQLGRTGPIPSEDTFIAGVSLIEVPYHEVWSRDRLVRKQGLAANSLRLGHLSAEFRARVTEPFETVHFLLRRAALDAFTQEEGRRRVMNLSCPLDMVDPITAALARTLLPFFDKPNEASPIFVDHVQLAVMAHLVDCYGDSRPTAATMAKGGLSPAQTRRAQEMLSGDLKGEMLIADIAVECGISRQHLIRAFKKTTGQTPHQWLQWRRADHAKDMLKNTNLPISDIALQCGFADQSHLTKVFTALVRATPAAWRRQNQGQLPEGVRL